MSVARKLTRNHSTPPSDRLRLFQAEKPRPPLKWPGGKRWLVPELVPIRARHGHRRFVEPFCGGLAVTLGLLPERGLLNDVNPHLINFYRSLQKGLRVAITTENDSELFYRHRERFNRLIRTGHAESSASAQLFYYLNRTGFNGLCRFNRSGEFNVPFGKYAKINYRRDFTDYAEVMRRWEITRSDFADLPVEPDDFIYADPPYDCEFTDYSREGFDWDDQVRLAQWLAAHPGPVVASNQATVRVLALYEKLGFTIRTLPAPRRISCNGDRKPAMEMLATKGV